MALGQRLRGLIRRPSPQLLQDIGRREHLNLEEEEAAEYARILDAVLANFDALDDLRLPDVPPVPRQLSGLSRPGPESDPHNCFVRVCELRSGDAGELAGVRVGLKDTVAIAGVPLTNGSRTAPYTPAYDAVVTERLLNAGAVIVGVLNMDDWSSGGTGETSAYGPPLNPIDPRHSAGGSSGGAGAAVASEAVDLAIGVDQAGSGRIPAAYCGVTALKPTHGLIPSHGLTHIAHSIDAVTPTARTVAQVARAVDVLAGFDERDPQSEYPLAHDARLTAALGRGVDGLRIGVIRESLDGDHCSDEMRVGVERAVEALEDAGGRVEMVSCQVWQASWPVAVANLCQLGWAMIQSEGQGFGHLGEVDAERVRHFAMSRRLEADQFPPFMKVWMLSGRYLHENYLSIYLARAQNARKHVRAYVDQLFGRYDVLISPTTPTTAPLLDFDSRGDFELLDRGLNGVNTAIFNLTGHPAMAVPSGAGAGGLPTSVQVVGRHFADAVVVRAAEVIERGLPARR